MRGVRLTPTSYESVLRYNPALECAARCPEARNRFFAMSGGVIRRVERLCWKNAVKHKVRAVLRASVAATGLLPLIKRIRKKK